MKIETDDLEILGGVRNGETLGSPVAVLVRNTEWPKWSEVMAVEPGGNRGKITRPRPGHADLAGMLKYDTDDARNVLERASARETAARTVAGVLAKTLLNSVDIEVISHVTAIGEVEYRGEPPPPGSLARIDESEVRCMDPEVSARMVEAIDRAREAKDSLGGIFEVIAFGVPVGIGSYVHYDRRLDGLLAQAVMSIPAIKGVEIGEGKSVASGPGSLAHDEIHAGKSGWERPTNRAGGIEGGMSNGEPVTVRAAMKPLSTLMRPLATVDTETGEPAQAVRERSDVCAVPAAAVVGEQMMALVLAAEMQRKFGGDSVGEFRAAVEAYRTRISGRMK